MPVMDVEMVLLPPDAQIRRRDMVGFAEPAYEKPRVKVPLPVVSDVGRVTHDNGA